MLKIKIDADVYFSNFYTYIKYTATLRPQVIRSLPKDENNPDVFGNIKVLFVKDSYTFFYNS